MVSRATRVGFAGNFRNKISPHSFERQHRACRAITDDKPPVRRSAGPPAISFAFPAADGQATSARDELVRQVYPVDTFSQECSSDPEHRVATVSVFLIATERAGWNARPTGSSGVEFVQRALPVCSLK